MAKANHHKQEQLLKKNAQAFFRSHMGEGKPLDEILTRLDSRGWHIYLFGGLLRDLMFAGATAMPRDIDIVVSAGNVQELQFALKGITCRENRFGGLHVEINSWKFDIWSLNDTWAFRHHCVANQSFSTLPETTFLNIEAIALEFNAKKRCFGHVYSSGFFEAIEDRTLEINFEHNPNPALNIVRSLSTACRMNYAIGPKLATYIVQHSKDVGLESHHGSWDPWIVGDLSEPDIHSYVKAIERQLIESEPGSIKIHACEAHKPKTCKYSRSRFYNSKK